MNELSTASGNDHPIFSRKVFVGGLPIDIDEGEIMKTFAHFGTLIVDWPRRTECHYPSRGKAGYVFLVFESESAVRRLVNECFIEGDKLYLLVSSPTMTKKPVQVRPWRLADADFVLDEKMTLDPRKTVFIGGVPRPLKAVELARLMDSLYGGVCYAGIDTDPELKYPKGAARVSFTNQHSFIAALSAKFVQIRHCDVDKRVEVKPYVMDDQMCDECQGGRCGGKYAPYFCPNISCLQYFCEGCWHLIHTQRDRHSHRPMAKLGEQGAKVMEHFNRRSAPALIAATNPLLRQLLTTTATTTTNNSNNHSSGSSVAIAAQQHSARLGACSHDELLQLPTQQHQQMGSFCGTNVQWPPNSGSQLRCRVGAPPIAAGQIFPNVAAGNVAKLTNLYPWS